MPANALPQPRVALPETSRFRRVYRDSLNRPLEGTVTLSGKNPIHHGDLTVLPAPVTVALTNGVLEVDLPPDTYIYQANLKTVEGRQVQDKGTVVLD